MRIKLPYAVALALVLLAQPIAYAQDAAEEADCVASNSGKGNSAKDKCVAASELLGALDLATPDNALFTLMGSTPEAVIRPKAGDKLMLSMLPQATDALGN